MDCPDKTRVALFVQGELPPEDGSRFEAHLDICESCLALIAEIAAESTARSLGTVEPRLPPDSVFVHLVAALARRSDRSDASDLPVARERLGPYRVIGTLGQGAMGIVYRAIHDESGREVALKTVAGTNPKLFAAMRQEIAFLEHHRHPGVVQILENGVVDGDPWYAMELLSGTTLEDFNRNLWRGTPKLAARSSSPPATAGRKSAAAGQLDSVLALFTRLCAPLGFVHRAGIVHCDLKPANVFIRHDGQPVLMDFGLLSRAGGAIGRESLEVGGRLRGTLPYISPELIRGKIPDARADLYALGCILYESVTGRPPFVEKTANGLLEAHLRAEPVPASELVSGVPQQLDEILAGLLAKRPDQRIGDADVVADLLTKVTRAPESPRRSPIPSTPYLFRPRMVGREAIVQQIQALRADAERGQGHFVLVSGESGIGKTFLASEIAQRAARAGFEVVTGECTPVAPSQQGAHEIVGGALEPFRKLLQNASDRCRDGGPETAMLLFGSELSIRLLARYEPVLGHLREHIAVENLTVLPPAAERERVLQALGDLLDQLVRDAPLLLVIDDLQWADDLSLAFLCSLSASAFANKRLLVLGLYRSDEAPKAIEDLEKQGHVRPIRLERLDTPALTTLVGDLLSDNAPARFVQTLARHSEGNPFFVAEYLRAAAAEGLLERTAAGWKLVVEASGDSPGYDALKLPRSLQALLERRLASLTPTAQLLTEAAAVLGREFRIAMLTTLAKGPASEDITRAIGEMLQRQVVQRVSKDGLRFLHDKTREAAYARIDSDRRRALHLATANLIEATYSATAELTIHYAELAYHLQRGGEATRAVDYFEKAGAHALATSANADALRLLREAQDLSTTAGLDLPPSRRALWERQLGEALLGLGDMAASTTHLCSAVTFLRRPMPAGGPTIAVGIASSAARQLVHRILPLSWLGTDSGKTDVLEAARAYEHLLQSYYYSGDYNRLLLANLRTLNLAERQKPSPTLAAAYTNAAITASIIPLRSVANLYFRLAEHSLSKAHERQVESYLRLVYAVYLSSLGRWEDSLRSNDTALELADALGFRRRWEEAAGVRCWSLRCRAMFADTIDWSNRLLESASRRGDRQMLSWALLTLASEYARRNDFGAVKNALTHHCVVLPGQGEPEQIRTIGLRLILAMEAGDLEGTAQFVEQATHLIRKTGPIHLHVTDAYAQVAEARLLLWKRAGGRRRAPAEAAKARGNLSILARAARIFPIVRPRHLLLKGAYRWISGDNATAMSLWKRALFTARGLEMPHEQACCLRTIADHLPAASTEAQAASTEAQTLFAKLGVPESRVRSLTA